MITISFVSLLDLLIRTMVLGQLLLLGGLLWRSPPSTVRHLVFAAGVSVAGLLMLTAPIPDEQYGLFRNVLLILTDAFAFIFWLLIRYLFDDDFAPRQWPRPIKLLLGLFVLTYFYALGVRAGVSPLHDLIHAVGLMLILHSAYVAYRGFADDLLDERRRARISVVLVISLYSTVLVGFEFADERYRNAAWFGLMNASVLLLAISVVIGRLFRLQYEPASRKTPAAPAAIAGSPIATLSAADRQLSEALDDFIARKGYHQNALTIGALARQLDCQEHRLRRLINQTRGYRNFNSLLNDLRVEDATDRLSDPDCDHLPILSIALDLGYDSVGPFNRAFKAKTDQTPGEFRRSVQNRR